MVGTGGSSRVRSNATGPSTEGDRETGYAGSHHQSRIPDARRRAHPPAAREPRVVSGEPLGALVGSPTRGRDRAPGVAQDRTSRPEDGGTRSGRDHAIQGERGMKP